MILRAIYHDHLHIIQRLFQDQRFLIDLETLYSTALRHATHIVEWLLQNSEISFTDCTAIASATGCGNVKIVEHLLKDSRLTIDNALSIAAYFCETITEYDGEIYVNEKDENQIQKDFQIMECVD